jgi:predicted nucleic acid-binding protein
MIFANAILIDTSAYYALKDKDDAFHTNALEFIKVNVSPAITTNLIVIETLNLFKKRIGHYHAVEIGKRLFNPIITTVIKVIDEDITNAWEIFQRYEDKGFSFTDCTTFSVMERLKIHSVFAFDEHFRQYGKFVVHPDLL